MTDIEAFAADNDIGREDIPHLFSKLAIDAYERYMQTGRRDDISKAIDSAKQGIDLADDNLATWLNNLGVLLASRYERTEGMRDLEEAIQTARRAIEWTPNDHPDLATRLNNLANMLGRRYERMGEIKDLEDSIKAARRAVESTPNDHPNLAGWLSNLGNKLESRFERTREMKDLEEAIQAARRAVEATPDGCPDQAAMSNNLGIKLIRRYERTEEMKDLEEAIETARRAVDSTPDDHPNLAAWLNNAGRFFERLYEQTGKMRDLGKASAYLLQAWSCLHAVPFHRVTAAAKCVASDLCAFLLSTNRLTEALECLEQGRAIIISQLLDDRGDLSSLRHDHLQLANRYQSLVDEVNAPTRQTTPGVVEALLRKRRQEAVAELDMCLKEIRCVPGHERFMLGQTVTEMQECITEGSIVVINITNFRSDAIIVSNNSLRTIVLPELSASKARLWHIIAEISASKTHPSEGLPRVWWIGSGLASSMPFHAAGVHTRGSTENAYCRLISSYTQSINELAYAQDEAKRAQEVLMA
ncbi:hypothetical protein DER46DRAFT_638595 [Fusarium sp. MPI-SDFR-AT-0072]|nr:hypothetical protein DER46DRAFT_638595 [Fusarium sp. MPI-SDFR-AT-0072]